jgi:uncharacterized protein YndB with AHSA1/START domain
MRPIRPETLGFLDHAPVRVTRRRRIDAAPDHLWEAVVDHERWPEWFDEITGVERLDDGIGVGGRRRVHLGAVAVEEEFLVWEPGRRFAFTATHVDKPGLRSMVEDVVLSSDGTGATTVTYTQAIETVAARITAPVLRRVMPRVLDRALAGLATHVGG